MEQRDFWHLKELKDRITQMKTDDGFLFQKARRIVIDKRDPHHITLYKGTSDAKKSKRNYKKSKKSKKDTVWGRELAKISDMPLRLKYSHGKSLKINALKVDDVQFFLPYLTRYGKTWLNDLTAKQDNAVPRPTYPEEETHEDNMQDDDDPQLFSSI